MTALNVLPYFHNFKKKVVIPCGGGGGRNGDFYLKKQNVTINVKCFFKKGNVKMDIKMPDPVTPA